MIDYSYFYILFSPRKIFPTLFFKLLIMRKATMFCSLIPKQNHLKSKEQMKERRMTSLYQQNMNLHLHACLNKSFHLPKSYIQIRLRTELTMNTKTSSWKWGVKQSKTLLNNKTDVIFVQSLFCLQRKSGGTEQLFCWPAWSFLPSFCFFFSITLLKKSWKPEGKYQASFQIKIFYFPLRSSKVQN